MIDAIFTDFPMPPSSNDLYEAAIHKVKFDKWGRAKASGKLTKTDKHRSYETNTIKWEIANKPALNALKEQMILRRKELESKGMVLKLKVEYYAVFSAQKLYKSPTVLNEIDTDNRIKPAKDALFRIFRTNDCHVFNDEVEKIEGQKERMIIRIKEFDVRTELDIYNLLGLKI